MKNKLRVFEGIIISTLLITFLVCPGLYAAEETLPTPEEIIAKNIESIGGIKALNKIKNKKIFKSSKYVSKDQNVKQTIYQKRPNNYYFVSDISTMGRVSGGSDGKIAWIIQPSIGARLQEGNVLASILMINLFDGPDGPDARYKSMKTEGIEQINGKDCYKVVKTPEIGTEVTVYYDKKSFRIVKKTITSEERYFKDYRKINNILFPYKEVIFSNGEKVVEVTTEKIECNIEMPEGIFKIPEEIKAIMDKNETEQTRSTRTSYYLAKSSFLGM